VPRSAVAKPAAAYFSVAGCCGLHEVSEISLKVRFRILCRAPLGLVTLSGNHQKQKMFTFIYCRIVGGDLCLAYNILVVLLLGNPLKSTVLKKKVKYYKKCNSKKNSFCIDVRIFNFPFFSFFDIGSLEQFCSFWLTNGDLRNHERRAALLSWRNA